MWYPLHVASIVKGEYAIYNGNGGVQRAVIELALAKDGVYGVTAPYTLFGDHYPAKYFLIPYGATRSEEFGTWKELAERAAELGIAAEPMEMKPVSTLVNDFRETSFAFYREIDDELGTMDDADGADDR